MTSMVAGSRSKPAVAVATAVALVMALLTVAAPPAQAADGPQQQRARVVVRDGTGIEVKLGGYAVDGEIPARPTIVEFTPYAPLECGIRYGEPYNHLCVHVRGTGSSSGSFDTLGPAAQRDVVDVLAWACEQPWSDGRLGLSGFSASAIIVYNSLHQELPCVETAVLGSGTYDLYRDLLYPGGIPNAIPALGVLGMISAPMVPAGPQRMQDDPASVLPVAQGLLATLVDYLANPSRNWYWEQRAFRGDVNELPILMTDGFFDVEARGAFQAFQELRDNGAHLRVFGAHDGIPAGAPDLHREERRWFDEHLRGIDTGMLDEPRVQLLLADGNRERMRYDGQFVRYDAEDWPVPGTRWETLHLRADRSGSTWSLNDGTIGLEPGRRGQVLGTAITSWPAATDPHTTSLLGFFDQIPFATDTRTADPLALAWTSEPFSEDVLMAGPGSLEVVLRSVVPQSDLYTVVSDVAPDGTSSPMAVGRLRTAYPHLEDGRSLTTDDGRVVQPHTYFGHKSSLDLLGEQRYHVELWPIGNRFKEGHRLRVHLVGASLFHLPTPGVNIVSVGEGGTQLHLPVLPGSDLRTALASAPGGDDGDLDRGSEGLDRALGRLLGSR